jgi:DNA-binding transcriptional regulator YiaG
VPPRTDELLAAIKAWCDVERGRRSELARIVGTSPQTVTHWFAGRKTPTLEQGLAIQEILKKAEKGSARGKKPVKGG